MFEFKDNLLSAEIKNSLNFDAIKETVLLRLSENKKGKRKGHKQLAEYLKNLKPNGFPGDLFEIEDLEIYPIIVITDDAFDSFGINYIVNEEFKNEITQSVNATIKDLIIIHIDTLIENQDFVHDRKIVINHTLDSYIEYTKRENNFFNKYTSFSKFLGGYLFHQEIDVKQMPRVIMKEVKHFF